MPIDFHDEKNRHTYASRTADSSWLDTISDLMQPEAKRVLDIGCGGGIYSRAWVQLGASQVIGIDFSEKMVQTARELSRGIDNLTFITGNAASTPLVNEAADIVFERALIHHITDLSACIKESHRLLRPHGVYVIQDRTLDDVKRPASQSHIRGFLFEAFPGLLEVEKQRRHNADEVENHLLRAGFIDVKSFSFWETRQRYENFAELAHDLRERTGRSLLHELTDEEIQDLIGYMAQRRPKDGVIIEKDHWTIWYARKAALHPATP